MNYVSEKDVNKILDGVSKKIPQGIMIGDTYIGHITWQMYLLKDYLKLDGTPLANASVDYKELLKFAQDNELITEDATDKSLFKYDSTTDVLTLPDYVLSSGEIGSILSYMGNNVPIGYLACDGTVYNIVDYSELAEFINTEFGSYNYFGGDGTTTFAVPDLRGEFLRGTGTNSHTNQGSGANVGTHQDGTEIPNIYLYSNGTYGEIGGFISNGKTLNYPNKADKFFNETNATKNQTQNLSISDISYQTITTTTNVSDTVYSIVRPTNTSVLYCIKYTNTFIPQIKYRTTTSIWDTVEIGKFVATAPSHYEREQLYSTNKTTITIYPTWININNRGYVLEGTKVIDLTNADNWDDSTYTSAAQRAGKDFYIYACEPVSNDAPDFILSANSTVPTGYTADNSRKMGGFHCLCLSVGTISGHTLSDYITGDILPNSPWDLKHRATSENEGMVYIPEVNKWVDIYLASWDGAKLVSAYNGIIADGASTPKFHGEKFVEEFGLVKKQLPSRDDFMVFAKGSNEGTNILGSADPNTTGGYVDTNNRRMISNYGLEDCCGALWQWTKDTQENYATASNSHAYWDGTNYYFSGYVWQTKPVYNPDCDPQSYGSCNGLLRRLIVGGRWLNSANCGSRCVDAINFGSTLNANIASRGCSTPRV